MNHEALLILFPKYTLKVSANMQDPSHVGWILLLMGIVIFLASI